MHRQDLRPSTNSSFSGIVNWQEHIKIYAYCWRKYNWEGSLEHLTCFCPKTNVFWAKITEVMTKNYIQAWESCFSSSGAVMGTGNLRERIKGRSDILCSKGAHGGGDVRSSKSLQARPSLWLQAAPGGVLWGREQGWEWGWLHLPLVSSSSSNSNSTCKFCTKQAVIFKGNGSRWALDLQPRCSTKIPHFPKSSGSAASPGAVHGTLLHIGPK